MPLTHGSSARRTLPSLPLPTSTIPSSGKILTDVPLPAAAVRASVSAVTSRDSEYSSSQFPCAAGGQGLYLTQSGQSKTLPIFLETRDSGTFWIIDCLENRVTAMNPLVQGSILVRCEVRQEMREGSMQAAPYTDCCFWEGRHITGRVFLSDRAPLQHLHLMGQGRGHRGR